MAKRKAKVKYRWKKAPRRVAKRTKPFLGFKGMSIKGLLAGTAGLIVAQRFQPFGGTYKPAVDKIALGLMLPMAKLDNQDMLSVGIKEGIATLVNQYLGVETTVTQGGGL